MLLTGKNAVVTGCLRGIGRQTLEVFAEHGANVWACAQHADPEFEAFCSALAARTGKWIKPLYFDLTDAVGIKTAMRTIQAEKLPADVLVNVAGYTKDSLFHMTSMDQLKLIFEVNYFSQILLMQAITKMMVKQGKGSVVNISRELASQGVRVNAIAPGVIDTDMNAAVPVPLLEERINMMSLPRMGTSHEIATVILFLASDLSSYMTGQVIRVDGGMR